MRKALPDSDVMCPICKAVKDHLGEHIRLDHGEPAFVQAVLDAKREGMSDAQIGERFGITFKQLERIVTRAYGVNVSILSRPKRIRSWEPINFQTESTTVWSFKQRGNWATHDGRYRGNWSPYIPRNLILRYTRPGDLVLDPFVGGGTTAVEAKLLGRRCIARDINPASVELTKQNLQFTPPHTLFTQPTVYEPDVSVGDARRLQGIADNSVDLICAHPPYAGIISYTSPERNEGIEGDLSQIEVPEFLQEMSRVASECYRVLKPGSKCAVLIGDTRKQKHVVPVGFETIEVFLRAGFRLKELVIKRQHNCKTTGFWTERSAKHNFLLLAHEYLPIFEKPMTDEVEGDTCMVPAPVLEETQSSGTGAEPPETTTVWVFPVQDTEQLVRANIMRRYGDRSIICTPLGSPLIPLSDYVTEIQTLVHSAHRSSPQEEFIVVWTRDARCGEYVVPLAKVVVDALSQHPCLRLKEIIVVAPSDVSTGLPAGQSLHITHQYLLVYKIVA